MVKEHSLIPHFPVIVKVVYPVRTYTGMTADDTVHLISFIKQKLCKIRSVLTGDSRDQSYISHCFLLF